MKHQTLFATCAMACAALLPGAAHAIVITPDPLTGPAYSEIEVKKSALTSTTTVDPNGQNVTSNNGSSFGNSRFGASYSTSSYTGALSTNVGFVYESFGANATVFGQTNSVLSSAVYAVTNGSTQTANIYNNIYVFGNQIRNDARDGGEFPNKISLAKYEVQVPGLSASETFYIGPVPLTVTANVKVGAEQTAQGRFWVDGVSGTLNQGTWVAVNATGGFGTSSWGAGVTISNLRLLDASLPLTATARFYDHITSACNQYLYINANYGVSLKELSGEVGLYAKAFFATYTRKIADWPGFSQYFPILKYEGSVWSGTCFPKPPAPVR